MLAKLLVALLLMALCVTIHAVGLAAAVQRLRRYVLSQPLSFLRSVAVLIGVAGWAIVLHLLQITVWAVFYALEHGMPDLPTALYFSAVTYTTTGYGDLVLPPEWRLVGGVEALTGILMCGLSTGFFFAVLLKTFELSDSSTAK
jgi:voltage-gated potassium channel Kch